MFDLTTTLAAITVVGTAAGITGYILMRQKFLKELTIGKKNQSELTRRAYQTAVLKEIGERIGYSLDAAKIVEIISGSLDNLLPYSTISHMIVDETRDKIQFQCSVRISVGSEFVKEVKAKMLSAISEMTQKPILAGDVDESITGMILDERSTEPLRSFFNLPIVISGKLVGLINVASHQAYLYNNENTEVLYKIAHQASDAVSKLQEVLENEKSRLSQAVQSLSDGLLMVDANYHLLLTNLKLVELLSTIPNPSLFDVANALSGQLDLRTKIEEVMTTNNPLPPWEIIVRDKVLKVFAAKVLDAKTEKPIAVVVLFEDITDAKSLEKLRQEFMAMMVHELRAPLTSIKSTVEMLKNNRSQVSPQDLSHSLSIIDSTSQTMLELISDLLDVAKIESGKFDIICESGDLAPVINERLEIFAAIATQKGLKLTVNLEPNLPEAYFDKVRIKQVFNNLLSNAIKYTDSGEITIKAKAQVVNGNPVDILVSVADTGIGIQEEERTRLFSKFGQLEAGRKRAGLKSSGLGLYIAREVVDATGGRIWVESAGSGMGSTFSFTVPLAHRKEEKSMEFESKPTISKIAHA